MLVRISDYPAYTGQGSDLARGALSVAASNQYFGIGIFPMHTADIGPGVLIGCSRYRTRVDDNQVRFTGGRGAAPPFLLKREFQNGTVSLRGTTSKAVQKKLRHKEYYSHVRFLRLDRA